jgi:hypothetical protein
LIFPDLRDSFLEGSIQEEILQIQENIQNFKHPHVEIHTQFILMSLKRICFKRLTIHMVKYSLIMHRSRGHYIFWRTYPSHPSKPSSSASIWHVLSWSHLEHLGRIPGSGQPNRSTIIIILLVVELSLNK